jgi:hypothetical protein
MNLPNNFDGLEKTHDGRQYITYALPLADPGSVTEIMIGSAAPSDAEPWLRQLLNELGYSGVPVIRSIKSPAAAVPAS